MISAYMPSGAMNWGLWKLGQTFSATMNNFNLTKGPSSVSR